MTMQYFKPDGDFFVGDCMPFFLYGTFRLFYLLDEGHHAALGGLGGHQWAQARSRDLVHWTHEPLAIPITEEREGSICTGSVLYHDGAYHGFYATRTRARAELLSHAISVDGVHFEKTQPNPFASPPAGYRPDSFRDPFAFRSDEDGLFHLLVTAMLEQPAIADRGGCLAHLVSPDLKRWEIKEPFLVPGLPGAPECPDYFRWNGWYYLVFSNHGTARYRLSRQPFGPWLCPRVDALDGPASRVMKTAAFVGGRRIGAAWLGTRANNLDQGAFQFGGNAVFRELVQHDDGTLGQRFPAEMIPAGDPLPGLKPQPLGTGATVEAHCVRLLDRASLAVAALAGVPPDFRLRVRVTPQVGSSCFGLCLRATEGFDSGYNLSCSLHEGMVRLGEQSISAVEGLDRPFMLEIVARADIIDVCVDRRRTIIDRCPERHGQKLLLYAQNADVTFDALELSALR